MNSVRKKIGYIHIQFPKLSETFVWREVEALGKLGVPIENFSIKRPFENEIDAHTEKFLASTVFSPPDFDAAVFKSHFYWLIRRPLAYIYILLAILLHSYPPGNWWLAWRKPLIFWRGVHLARMIELDGEIAHLHAHFKYVAIYAWIAHKLTGIPYSYTAHFATNALMVGRISDDARFVVASTNREKEIIEKLLGDNSKTPVVFVRLGLQDEHFTEKAAKAPANAPTIISVGRLIPKKGHNLLIASLALLKKRGVAFTCEIVGDGPLMDDLQSMVKENTLLNVVKFAGYLNQTELKNVFDDSDIFALFCTHGPDGDVDGLPVAIMEAMARGLPVVSTNLSALGELVEDGKSGYLVQPGDVKAFADALEKLIADESLRKKMGQAGRKKVMEEFRLDIQAHEMKSLFEKFAGGGRNGD